MGRNPRSTVIALNWPYRLPDELASGTCASGKYPPDWWFPRSGDALGRERAQHMCRSCPALAACRAYVDACDSELRGIWAATTREEREQQRLAKGRERRRAARKAGDAA